MSTLVVTGEEITQSGYLRVLSALFEYQGEDYTVVCCDDLSDNRKKDYKGYQHILSVGPIATQKVFKQSTAVKITKVRGGGFIVDGHYCVPTWDFTTIFKDPDLYRDFEKDVFKCIANTKVTPHPQVEVHILDSPEEFHYLEALHEASYVSCDIETTGFNPVSAELLSVGFCALTGDHEGYVVVVPKHLFDSPDTRRFLETYQGVSVLHNAKFDLQFMWAVFGEFIPPHLADTMLMAYTLDERPFNRYKHLSLKDLARVYLDAPDYALHMGKWIAEYEETVSEGDLDHVEQLLNDLYEYQALDCYYTAALYEPLREEMDDESPRLQHYHDSTLVPATYTMARMELVGVEVDTRYLKKMLKEIEAQLETEMKEIQRLVKRHTTFGKEFNPNSPKQVAEILYNAGDEGGLGLAMPVGQGRYAYKREPGTVTTNSDTLKILARQVKPKMPAASKLINLILSYRVKSKIIGTYVNGLLQRIDEDGRIRGDFNLHGTATGRLSCSNPNLQNIPDASHVGFDIRKAYKATSGWVMLEADYSQLELRIAALYSQDPILLEAYRKGADIHQEVAFMLWKKPKDEITKYERYLAKCMNFGVLYGRGAKSIATGPEMDNLIEMSGRKWSETEINDYFYKFKEGYSALFEWMDLVSDYGYEKKMIEAPLGSRRRWPFVRSNGDVGSVRRQIANTPIQGFAAQLTTRAIVEIEKRFDRAKQRVLFTVHDSIVCECLDDPEIIRETGAIIRDVMENHLPEDGIVPFPMRGEAPMQMGDRLTFNIPFVSDISYGKNWGECKHDPEKVRSRRVRVPV